MATKSNARLHPQAKAWGLDGKIDNYVQKVSPKPPDPRGTVQKSAVYTRPAPDKLKPPGSEEITPKTVVYTGREYDMQKIHVEENLWFPIAKAYQNGTPVTGCVNKQVNGGLQVIIQPGSLSGFLPTSQIKLHVPQNLEQYVGKVFEMKVINVDRSRNDIILSRLVLLKKKKADLINTLKVGQRVIGVVKKITDFGAFVNLDGIDGLIRKNDMARKRIRHPSEILSVGEEIEVQVIDIDRNTEKISLGLKQTALDPWMDVEKKYIIGSTVQGKVVNIVNFGVFLQLEEGVEGLIHISELADQQIETPTEIVSIGEELEVKVINVDPQARKIGLSLKTLIVEQHHDSS
ncbi:S1 RNA-binding domain-containing protein, partial [Candidatus Poribacteria bacterium]|nr:S1 RNA-binding domain-containing protein [Candidatus Poribacteria bacterium]